MSMFYCSPGSSWEFLVTLGGRKIPVTATDLLGNEIMQDLKTHDVKNSLNHELK